MSVIDEIAAERRRQIEAEGYTAEHDDRHDLGELGLLAALHAIPYDAQIGPEPLLKQDDYIGLDMALEIACGFKRKPEPDRRRRLIKAAALLVAEIERLDRAAGAPSETRTGATP